jgi:hypothetical protein
MKRLENAISVVVRFIFCALILSAISAGTRGEESEEEEDGETEAGGKRGGKATKAKPDDDFDVLKRGNV